MTRPPARLAVLALAALLAGCATPPRELMPTPLVYLKPNAPQLFTQTPEQRSASPSVDLFYITDRGPDPGASAAVPYGQARARNLAFGNVRVNIGPNASWDRLLSESAKARRTAPMKLELGAINPLGHFPDEPYGVVRKADGLHRDPAVLAAHEQAASELKADLGYRVAQAQRKEVVLYVHGFNETFESAAFTAAELCHFLGREPVCAFFTWPASSTGNFLTSYTNTTESAQYAVGHLKKAIRLIAETPGVEHIQLLAHSRGTALTLSAVRELVMESIAAGKEPLNTLKINNIVMFSPDIDVDIASQDLTAFISDPDLVSTWPSGRLPRTMRNKLTVYSSPSDRALLVSKILFRSRVRVGELRAEDIPEKSQDYLAKLGRINIIVFNGKRTDIFGHSYFTTNPQVSADVIELLRYNRNPGDPGRDLIRTGPVTWTFPPAGRARP